MKNIEKAIARAQVQGEVAQPLEFILDVAVVLCLAQSIAGQSGVECSCVTWLASKAARRGIGNFPVLRVSMVQLHAPNLHSGLQNMCRPSIQVMLSIPANELPTWC